ncbi:adhesion G protein-coupled receptor E1-like [Brienomyrus brachyistius]|uniref:adhesion G protein-coupled receptor E1-like n=1 Tax=Brienomyrus brachyistius TaxID=42636 RepID=UPI0020B2227D|nr:adhesion G protein-coupled receptor E1-like [Brienomyrus brachyistius]
MGSKVHLLILGFHLSLLQMAVGSSSCPFGQERFQGKCKDVNECIQYPGICGMNASCSNTEGNYYCKCDDGFVSTSKTDTFTAVSGFCIDRNECLDVIGICGPNAKCQNTIGSYYCSCLDGYSLKVDQNIYCTDINECLVDSSICGKLGMCRNEDGGYRCQCNNGTSNFGDKRAHCVELKCESYETAEAHQQTLLGLDSVLSLMRNSCLELSQMTGGGGQMNGEILLGRVLNASDTVLSSDTLQHKGHVSKLLSSMENILRLIGPQLRGNHTRLETHHTEADVWVRRERSPPQGPVHLSTEHVQLSTTWENALGASTYPGFAVVSMVTYKNLESSTNVSVHGMGHADDKMHLLINSKVVTVYTSNPNSSHLSTPVNFTFSHLKSREAEQVCVYWDSGSSGGAWSPQGCVMVDSNSTHTICSCSHLSSFAVLMALYEIKGTFQLQVITWVGLSLSLVCLFLCIVTFSCCRSIQGTRNTIHLHLCISLFIADLIFLIGISSTHNRLACAFVAGLLHLFFLSAFCWMCLEGIQLYRMVVLVFNTTLRFVYMLAVGYGLPLLIVAISAIAYSEGYGTQHNCWLSLERGFIWSFLGPVCVIIIVNVIFFIITLFKLAQKFSSLNPDLSKLRKIKTFTITAIAQLCVLGTMWIFGYFQFEESSQIMSYLFTMLNSLQGVLIFIMHCLLSKQVREEYARFLFCIPMKKKRKDKYSESSSSQALRMTQSTGESQA